MHLVEEYQDIITLTMDGLNECEIVTLAGRRVGVKLLYNPGEDRKSVSWGSDELETRCGRESQHPAEGALRPLIEQFGDQTSWRVDAGLRNMSQRGWAPRPPVEQPRRTGKKRCCGHRRGGQYVAVLFGLQLPLTHNPFNKVRGIFF